MALNAEDHKREAANDYFELYRRGDGQQWNAWQRAPHYMAYPHPRREGRWPGIRPDPAQDDMSWDGGNFNDAYSSTRHEDSEPYVLKDKVRERAPKLAKAAWPFALNYVQTLGWGGQGLVILFDARDNEGNLSYHVVKCPLYESDDPKHIRDEKEVHANFLGAKHVVQIHTALYEGGAPAPRQFPLGQYEETEAVLVMEYLPRGTIHKALCTYTRAEDGAPAGSSTIPDRVLWHIFDCLLRSVVALAYPPKLQPDYEEGTVVEEQVPAAPRRSSRRLNPNAPPAPGKPEARNFIHFDIDPTNILVGEFDDKGKHSVVPTIKLSDFGICREWDADNVPAHLFWSSRRFGKSYWSTPEQFTEEWEYFPGKPGPEHRVAGKYTWKTNLWGIAQVMWCLITQSAVRAGPKPQRVRVKNKELWTYGAYLLDDAMFGDTDMRLRRLVMRCMMDDPADRPELAELLGATERKLRGWDTTSRSARGLRQWSETFFSAPPPPAVRPLQELDEWLAGEAALDDPRLGPIGLGPHANAAQAAQQLPQGWRYVTLEDDEEDEEDVM